MATIAHKTARATALLGMLALAACSADVQDECAKSIAASTTMLDAQKSLSACLADKVSEDFIRDALKKRSERLLAEKKVGAFAASIVLLLRRKLALPIFVLSFAAFAVSLLYTYVLTNGGAVMGTQMAIASAVIAALLVFFIGYSRFMTVRGVLR